jgi:hypothetical protein
LHNHQALCGFETQFAGPVVKGLLADEKEGLVAANRGFGVYAD